MGEAKGAAEVESNDLPNLEGLKPTEIEKIMVEELLTKPKKKKGNKESKAPVTFEETVRPILKQFKKQLLDEKKEGKEGREESQEGEVSIKKRCQEMQGQNQSPETKTEGMQRFAENRSQRC